MVMKKKAKKQAVKKGAWFKPVRGSFLPCSWQGWLIEFVMVTAFALGMLAFKDQNLSGFIVAMVMLPYTLSLGIIATWIAQKTS